MRHREARLEDVEGPAAPELREEHRVVEDVLLEGGQVLGLLHPTALGPMLRRTQKTSCFAPVCMVLANHEGPKSLEKG